MTPEHELWVSRYLDGTAGPEELQQLNELIRRDEAFRVELCNLARQDAILCEMLAGQEQVRPNLPSGADMKFYFCEKCGKRVTEHDIAAGAARDKKLKGVYCAECGAGVLTLETMPVTEAQARQILSRESKTESRESRAASHESTAAGLDSQSDRPKPVTRKFGAVPLAAPPSGPATRDSRPETRDSLPDVHYGTGIHKFVKGEARSGSSRRLPALRRTRPVALGRPLWPIFIAAGVMVAVSLWLALGRGGGLTHVAPPEARQGPKAREAFEKNRLAHEELARREEAARQAQEKSAQAEAARKQAEEKLAELERKKQDLVGQASSPAAGSEAQKQEAEEARRQELAHLEAQQKAEAEKLAQAETQARQAAEEVARTQAEQKEAERKLAAAQRKAEELGRVIFVVELKKEAPGSAGVPPAQSPSPPLSAPILVRGQGAQATRTPLTKDTVLLKGDRIETQPSAFSLQPSARPVHAALELFSGATVDLADATIFEVLDPATSRLNSGLLYAEVSGVTGKAGRQVVQTEHANVETEHASFDLRAGEKEALVQVAEGSAKFKNPQGETDLKKLQKSLARKDYAPGPTTTVLASGLWQGRKTPDVAAGGPVLFTDNFNNSPVDRWPQGWRKHPTEADSRSGFRILEEPGRPGERFLAGGSKDCTQHAYVPLDKWGARFEVSFRMRLAGGNIKRSGLEIGDRPDRLPKLSFEYTPGAGSLTINELAGDWRLLKQAACRLEFRTWHAWRIAVDVKRCEVTIDGKKILEVECPGLSAIQTASLIGWGDDPVHYDDFRVTLP